MSVAEEKKRLLERPSVSTLDSECDYQLDSHIDSHTQDNHQEQPLSLRDNHLQHPLPLRTTRAGLVVPCTELPAPRMLRDNGYVDVISSHVPKHVIVQSLDQNLEEGTGRENRSPPRHLALPHKRSQHSVESHSPHCSSSGSAHRPSPLVPSSASNATGSLNSSQSAGSNHFHSLELLTMSFNSSQDLALNTYTSPRMSPVEPQPLTMPDIEDSPRYDAAPPPKRYFTWAFCSTVLCCPLVGVVAMIMSRQVLRHYSRGDLGRSVVASRNARRWSIIAVISGSVLWTVTLVIVIVTLVLMLLA